ncbi:hypothetical protein [Tsukamurella asaccharolytica]|uniref:hypothetical protein n=1 Tax=Tsukamurella asaccharolytica TaxID=2592067 RepID=UPI001E5432C4|nr:hypothetical protein [Tsukamurella asaccharolytica]
MFPASDAVERLFAPLGQVTVADTEARFSALSAVTATISTHFAYLRAITDWLAQHGWERRAAEEYVRGVYSGVGDAVAAEGADLATLVGAHETAGGINERFRELWFDARSRASLHTSLDHILARVSSPGSDLE